MKAQNGRPFLRRAVALAVAVLVVAPQSAQAAELSNEQMTAAAHLSLGAKKIGLCEQSEPVTSGNAYLSRTPVCKLEVTKAGNYSLLLDISEDAGVVDWAKVTISGSTLAVDSSVGTLSGEGETAALLFDSTGDRVFDNSASTSHTKSSSAIGYKLVPGTYYASGYCISLVPHPGYSMSLVTSTSLEDARISLSKKSYVLADDDINEPDVTVKLGGVELGESADFNVKYSGQNKIGAATATITGRGLYYGTRKVRYLILPAATKIKAVKARRAGTISYVAISWQKEPKYSGYQVRYSARKSMDGAAVTNIAASKAHANIGIAGKTRGKRAYFQVRTFKTVNGKRYYSAWSAKKSVRTMR